MFGEHFKKKSAEKDYKYSLILGTVLLILWLGVVVFNIKEIEIIYIIMSGVFVILVLFGWIAYFHQRKINAGKAKENPRLRINYEISAGYSRGNGYMQMFGAAILAIMGLFLVGWGIFTWKWILTLAGVGFLAVSFLLYYEAKYNFWMADSLSKGKLF